MEPTPSIRWEQAKRDLDQAFAKYKAAQIVECKARRELSQAMLIEDGLTRREIQVMDGIKRGLQNKEIADELRITVRTVKFHVSALLCKLDVRSRREL